MPFTAKDVSSTTAVRWKRCSHPFRCGPTAASRGRTPDVRFIHRTTEQGDIYFLSNQQERKVVFEAAFRTEDGAPELWDALTGVVRRLPGFSRQDGVTTVPLELDPYGSAFIVFDRTKEARQSSAGEFPRSDRAGPGRGAVEGDFRGAGGPRSPGRARYALRLDRVGRSPYPLFLGNGPLRDRFRDRKYGFRVCRVDLGKVMVMGRVFLNGVCAGGTWTPPYRVDVSGLIREGRNVLEVEVAEQLDEPVDRRSAAAARTTQDLDARQPVDRIFGVAVFRTARPCGCREIRL